jgi:hypothetical protein
MSNLEGASPVREDQPSRVTMEDRVVQDGARSFHVGPGEPVVTHLIAQDISKFNKKPETIHETTRTNTNCVSVNSWDFVDRLFLYPIC